MQVTINRKVLELHRSAADPKSRREHLQGVWIEPVGDQSVATASNGHVLSRINGLPSVPFRFMIPADVCKNALKSKADGFVIDLSNREALWLQVPGGARYPVDQPSYGETPNWNAVAKDARENATHGMVYLDARLLLAVCQQAIAASDAKGVVGLSVRLPEPGAPIALQTRELAMVAMPIRSDEEQFLAWGQAFPTVEPQTDTLKRDDITLPASAAA